MSPRLLYLLTILPAPFPFGRERDRVDAPRAATRLLTPVGVLP